ncbi:MAG: MBL fold metallo-hydrolase [Xanthomonadales bacterium]|nr:MBL fold metallo-hydrolase [Xanthomonadales bacterium]MCB1611119.1 MBL fold metallo-hydrolase [Xanthomonadales bacterium]
MATDLYHSGSHRCIAFNDLVRGDDGVQANQFLILHEHHSALIDPGGALLYTPVSMAVGRYVPLKELTWILASHQDPDVIGSADRWLMYTNATIACSRLWGRFVPHSVPHYVATGGQDRYRLIPDAGTEIVMGSCRLKALPAHYLHSVGNFHFYDPISKILFSGDLGASMVDRFDPVLAADFDSHIPSMLGFHRRYMAGNRACRIWADQVARLDIEMIVPQHGRPIGGKAAVQRFIDWVRELQCGMDLMTAPGEFA